MAHNTLIVAVDLGTSAATASHALVQDSFDNRGKLHRKKFGSISDVQDWPGCIEGATGNVCVPTDLIFHRETRELLFWGFEAQQYLDDLFNDISHDDVFVVETIKLLLPNPDRAKVPSTATERYRAMREVLIATLGKQPEDVFEDFMNPVLDHIVHNAIRKYSIGLHNHHVELILAFPSGWPDQIHTAVARIGARALQRAIVVHKLKNMTFGIENVYTVSETLCGIKEWLREAVAEASAATEFDPQATNLDELNVGDCFLPADIGGGTGCLTPLRLVSKNPLGVEQLDKTQSLEVCGEAVQAEFQNWLRPQITKKDYPGDIERLIYQICRKFKEEKKKCGAPPRPGSKTWNFPVPRLKANIRKGFEKDCMRFDRRYLEKCFDPVIDLLEEAIEETMRKFPAIKAIVFLGQFGGTSAYLRKRMAMHPISGKVKIRHSQSGKLDVVKGAISERLTLEETFVRKFQTLKSYGTLVTLRYGDKAEKIFPKPHLQGALPFERANDGPRLKVIEWAIPKGTIVEDGRAQDIGKDGRRFHTWPYRENDLGFEDIIVVSDEDVPPPQLDGKSYTLWTKAHQNNQLYIDGHRKQVKQIPFCWDLIMSQKLDRDGNIVGPYGIDELRSFWFPEKKTKGHRRERLRDLHYDLIWEITEMQVKVYVQAIFRNQVGLPLAQLAKEQALSPEEKTVTGESRSKALDNDIKIANDTNEEGTDGDEDDASENEQSDTSNESRARASQMVNELARYYAKKDGGESSGTNLRENQRTTQEQAQMMPRRTYAAKVDQKIQAQRNPAASGILRQSVTSQGLLHGNGQPSGAALTSNTPRTDGRRRDGCWTCKNRKKKCDCAYVFDETSGNQKCNFCLRIGITCHLTAPDWVDDPAEREFQERERKRLVKIGKRKSRDESVSSGIASRDRSMTLDVARHPTLYRSIETAADGSETRDPRHR